MAVRRWPAFLAAVLAVGLSAGIAEGARLIRVPRGASSLGIDAIRGTAYVANRGGLFGLDSSASRLVSAFALGRFDTIGDVDPVTGLVAVYVFAGGSSALGIFDPATGGVRSLEHGGNPPQGAVFAGELVYVPIYECFGQTCGPKLEAVSHAGDVVAYLDLPLIVAPSCAARSPDGSAIVVGDPIARTVTVVSTASFTVTDAFPVGAGACPIAVGHGQAVVAGNSTSATGHAMGSVVLRDLSGPHSVPRVIAVGRSFVRGVAVDPNRGVAYAVTSRAKKQRSGRETTTRGGRLFTLRLDGGEVRRRTPLAPRFGALEAVAVTTEGKILVGTDKGVVVLTPDR